MTVQTLKGNRIDAENMLILKQYFTDAGFSPESISHEVNQTGQFMRHDYRYPDLQIGDSVVSLVFNRYRDLRTKKIMRDTFVVFKDGKPCPVNRDNDSLLKSERAKLLQRIRNDIKILEG